jgi:hypothetical protein
VDISKSTREFDNDDVPVGSTFSSVKVRCLCCLEIMRLFQFEDGMHNLYYCRPCGRYAGYTEDVGKYIYVER